MERGEEKRFFTSNSHSQWPRFLVSGEAHIIEPERDTPIDGQCDRLLAVHLRCAKLPHSIELPARPSIQNALDERQRAHSHEQVQRVQFQPPSGPGLEHVRDNGFERGEEGAEERENEPPEGEIVVAVGREANSGDDGNESQKLFNGYVGTDHGPRKDHCE